jgi:hypothetical protein
MRLFRIALLCATLLLVAHAEVPAADNMRGAVEQTGGTKIPQNPALPKLNLTDAQREQIRQTLLTKNTHIEFKMKETKPAETFTPKVGAELPKSVMPGGIPAELTQHIPQLADYGYAKMRDQILLVNALTKKIVAIIPEAQPQTTGHQ